MSNLELKAAYQRLEEAIDAVCRLEEYEGVLVEWGVLAASQRFDDDGDGITQVGTLLPEGGGQVPFHRVMGLVDFVQARLRAQAAHDDD